VGVPPWNGETALPHSSVKSSRRGDVDGWRRVRTWCHAIEEPALGVGRPRRLGWDLLRLPLDLNLAIATAWDADGWTFEAATPTCWELCCSQGSRADDSDFPTNRVRRSASSLGEAVQRRERSSRVPADRSREVDMSNTVETAIDIRPFHIEVSEEALDDLRRRINATRWPDPTSSTSTKSTGATTSRPGRSRSSSPPSFVPPSGRCGKGGRNE
jgi:hypothetical protein